MLILTLYGMVTLWDGIYQITWKITLYYSCKEYFQTSQIIHSFYDLTTQMKASKDLTYLMKVVEGIFDKKMVLHVVLLRL